jgi:hypothetical protein
MKNLFGRHSCIPSETEVKFVSLRTKYTRVLFITEQMLEKGDVSLCGRGGGGAGEGVELARFFGCPMSPAGRGAVRFRLDCLLKTREAVGHVLRNASCSPLHRRHSGDIFSALK